MHSKLFKTCFVVMILFIGKATSQEVITVSTENTALVLQTDKDSSLLATYLGKKLKNTDEYAVINSLDKFKVGNDDLFNKREAYVASGSLNLMEPALSVTHSDGNKSAVLQYVSHEVKKIDDNQTLTTIVLKDTRYKFQVTLFYKAYYKEDVIEQWSEIEHKEKGNVVLNKYASANLTLQGKKFFLKNHYSGWGREMLSEEQQLLHGIRTLDSKLGTRSNLLHSSSFMISINKPAEETEGEVIAGSLEWSGNFKIDFETFDEYYLRVVSHN